MKEKNLAKTDLMEGLILFVLGFCCLSRFYDSFSLLIYQGRDIQRAIELVGGKLIWFGPELTGGGYLPGPFYYWLLAFFPSQDWQALVWACILLADLAAVGLWYLGKHYFSPLSGLLIFFFFINSRIITHNMSAFWNPSFIFVFQALILFLLFDSFTKNRSRVFFGGLILGLSLQIHFMQLLFLAGIFAAVWFTPKIPRKVRFRQTLWLVFPILITLVPYGVGLLSGKTLSVNYTPFLAQDFLNIQRFKWNLPRFFEEMIAWDVQLFLCAFAWPVAGIFRRSDTPFPTNPFFLWTLVFSVPVFLALGSSWHTSRHLVPFFVLFILVSVPIVEWLKTIYRFVFYLVFYSAIGAYFFKRGGVLFDLFSLQTLDAIFVFLILSAFAIIFLYRDRQKGVLLGLVFLTVFSSEVHRRSGSKKLNTHMRLAEALVENTGWSFEYFRERAYVLGILPVDDLSVFYRQAYRNSFPPEPRDFDGVLVIRSQEVGSTNERASDRYWKFAENVIPREIFEAAKNGEFSCLRLERVAPFQICFYKFKDPLNKVSWNNLGYPYQFQQKAIFQFQQRSGYRKTSATSGVFYFNNCQNFAEACSVFVDVKVAPKRISIRAFGDPISVPDQAMNTQQTAFFENLTIDYRCGERKYSWMFASHLGFPDRRRPNYPEPFLLGPLERTFKTNCKEPIIAGLRSSLGVSVVNNFVFADLGSLEISVENEQSP